MPWVVAPGSSRAPAPPRGPRRRRQPTATGTGGWKVAPTQLPEPTVPKKTPPPKKKQGGGGGGVLGFLGGVAHGIEHTAVQGAYDLKDVAVNSPAGIYHAGGAVYRSMLKPPWMRSKGDTAALGDLASAMYHQTVADLRHPLRHPGFTALDVLALASAGAGAAERVGMVGRGLRAGEGAGSLKRLAVRPARPPLELKAGGVTVTKPAARPALTNWVQRVVNHYRNMYPEAPIGVRSQVARVGKAEEKNRLRDFQMATSRAVGVAVEGKKIKWNSPLGAAMRTAAEGAGYEDRIGRHTADLVGATEARVQKAIRSQIGLLKTAERKYPLVRDAQGKLRFKDPKLEAQTQRVQQAALEFDRRAQQAGLLTNPEQAIHNPGRLVRGASYETILSKIPEQWIRPGMRVRPLDRENVGRILSLDYNNKTARVHFFNQQTKARATVEFPWDQLARESGGKILGEENFQGGRFHVGYQRRNKPFAATSAPAVGSQNTVGIPRTPAPFKNPLTGKVLSEGAFRNDVPRQVAENIIEGERHLALLRARDWVIQHAQDTPEGIKNPVAVRLDALKNDPFPEVVKDFQDAVRQGRQVKRSAYQFLGPLYDQWRAEIFPQIKPDMVGQHEGVKWIDQRLLGDLNKQNPLATFQQHTAGRAALATVDAVNNASKAAILYLKPAYAVPNMIGNLFLTLTQQGWAAPANIGRAVLLWKRLNAHDRALVDTLMGEGISGSLGSVGGVGTRAVNLLASKWGILVDLPFRRASFLYEARKELGLRGARMDYRRLRQLLHDEKQRPALYSVTERANRALIEYNDLNKFEQAVIRRVFFFYPWLKGSTKYVAHYLRENPIQAGVLGQIGQIGTQDVNQLGPLPSYAQGYFKVGGSPDRPLVVNPTAIGILSQPAQLAAVAASLAAGHVQPAYQLNQLLSPYFGSELTALQGYDPFTRRPVEPNLRTFGSQLAQGNPILTLIQRLTSDQTARTFPLTRQQALLQYLLGSAAPKTANLAKLHQAAANEQKPPR